MESLLTIPDRDPPLAPGAMHTLKVSPTHPSHPYHTHPVPQLSSPMLNTASLGWDGAAADSTGRCTAEVQVAQLCPCGCYSQAHPQHAGGHDCGDDGVAAGPAHKGGQLAAQGTGQQDLEQADGRLCVLGVCGQARGSEGVCAGEAPADGRVSRQR